MPSDRPERLRRWWWKSPLPARLIPAFGVLAMVTAAIASIFPATQQGLAGRQPPPASRTPPPAQTPPTSAASEAPLPPPPPAAPAPATETVISTVKIAPPPPGTTTRKPAPTYYDPPAEETAPPATTGSGPNWVPVVEEGQPCQRQNDFAQDRNGAAASCQPDENGRLRWTTRW